MGGRDLSSSTAWKGVPSHLSTLQRMCAWLVMMRVHLQSRGQTVKITMFHSVPTQLTHLHLAHAVTGYNGTSHASISGRFSAFTQPGIGQDFQKATKEVLTSALTLVLWTPSSMSRQLTSLMTSKMVHLTVLSRERITPAVLL